MTDKSEELKRRILEEMTVDYADILEKNFNLVKKFVRITKEGKVELIIKEKIDNKEKVLLYLLGKLYAKTAELSETEVVGNKELIVELGIPEGSVKPTLKTLREEGKIIQTKEGKNVFHSIKTNLIERFLKSIQKKTEDK